MDLLVTRTRPDTAHGVRKTAIQRMHPALSAPDEIGFDASQ